MTRLRRPAVALLLLLTLYPSLALGQAPKAGVVTTLKGSATATRVALPRPVPLKFKDDVFLQDRIATAEQSLARLLLGGKAVVTIRERSLLAITEVPDRATLNLQTGKIALAIAREKMRPGEVIEIRTPNAVAAVRGTVVVVETEGGVTKVYVLSDPTGRGVEVTLLDPATGAPIGAPITLAALQGYSTATGQIITLTLDQVFAITFDLRSDPQHIEAVNQAAIVASQMETAVALVESMPELFAAEAPPPLPFDPNPKPWITEVAESTGGGCTTGCSTTEETSDDPLFKITGPFNGSSVRSVDSAGLTLHGPLAVATDANLNLTDGILGVSGGTVTSNEAKGRSVILIDPSSVTAANVVRIDSNGSINVHTTLVEALDTTFVLEDHFLDLFDPGILTNTGTASLVKLQRGSVDTFGFVSIGSASAIDNASSTLVEAHDTTFNLFGPFLEVFGTLTTGALPAVTLAGVSLTAQEFLLLDGGVMTARGSLLSASNSTVVTGSVVTLEGGSSLDVGGSGASAIKLSGGVFVTDFLFAGDASSNTVTLGGSVLEASNNATVHIIHGVVDGLEDTTPVFNGVDIPVFRLTDSDLSLGGSGSELVGLGANLGPDFDGLAAIITGRSDVGTQLGGNSLLHIAGIHTTSTQPLVQILNDALVTGDIELPRPLIRAGGVVPTEIDGLLLKIAGSTVSGFSNLFEASGVDVSVTLNAPLLESSSSDSVTTTVTTTGDFIGIFSGADLTSNTESPFVKSSGSVYNIGAHFLGACCLGGSGGTPASIHFSGPLLDSAGDIFNIGDTFSDDTFGVQAFIGIFGGASLTSDTSAPFVTSRASSFDLLGPFSRFLAAFGGPDGSTSIRFAGSLLDSTGDDLVGGDFFIGAFSGATLTSDTTAPFITSRASSFDLGGVFLGACCPADPLTPPASIHFSGPLLDSTGDTLSFGAEFVFVFSSGTLTSETTAPFVTSHNSAFDIGGSFLALCCTSPDAVTPAAATFEGPLLNSTGDTFSLTADFVEASSGGEISRTQGTSPFLQFSGSTATAGRLALVAGSGLLSLTGPLASVDAAGVPRWELTGLVFSEGAGALDTNGNTDPLVLFSGTPVGRPGEEVGIHRIAPSEGQAMFELVGVSKPVLETDPDAAGLLVGADDPIRHEGELFRGVNTAVQTNQFLRLDPALYEATRPLLNLIASSMTSSSDLVNLAQQSKLTALVPADALVMLNNSLLTIDSGSLVALANGSFMNITGNLISLTNGSTLDIHNGGLVSVSGGSAFKLTGGSLGFFGTTGTNILNIANTPCGGACSLVTNIPNLGGVPVLLVNGGLASNVIVAPGFVPFTNLTGANQLTLGSSAAVLVVDGSTSRVKLAP